MSSSASGGAAAASAAASAAAAAAGAPVHRRTVFVGSLAADVSVDLLRAAFVPFGDVTDVHIQEKRGRAAGGGGVGAGGGGGGGGGDDRTRRRFGFVEFELPEDAAAAVDNIHGSELLGVPVTCSIAKPGALTPREERVAEGAAARAARRREKQQPQQQTTSGAPGAPGAAAAAPEMRVRATSVQMNAPAAAART